MKLISLVSAPTSYSTQSTASKTCFDMYGETGIFVATTYPSPLHILVHYISESTMYPSPLCISESTNSPLPAGEASGGRSRRGRASHVRRMRGGNAQPRATHARRERTAGPVGRVGRAACVGCRPAPANLARQPQGLPPGQRERGRTGPRARRPGGR